MEIIIIGVLVAVVLGIISAAVSGNKKITHDDLIDDDEMFIEDSERHDDDE